MKRSCITIQINYSKLTGMVLGSVKQFRGNHYKKVPIILLSLRAILEVNKKKSRTLKMEAEYGDRLST